MSNNLEEVGNSLMDQMINIQKTLGPFDSTGIDFDSSKMSKDCSLCLFDTMILLCRI